MLRGLAVLHDYYFDGGSPPGVVLATAEGLLVTGGLLVAPRSALASARRATACTIAFQGLTGHTIAGGWSESKTNVIPVPYLGLGYADLPNRMGWGFCADFGLMALSPHSAVSGQRSAVSGQRSSFGSALSGAQGIYDLLRDMWFSPLGRIDVWYSFRGQGKLPRSDDGSAFSCNLNVVKNA
ncbi:MAG: hypothetical protein WCJ87_00580 [Burkholderiales bacterium]